MSINLVLASNNLTSQKEIGLINPDFLSYLRKIKNKHLQLICCLSTYEKTYLNKKQQLILKNEIDILKATKLISVFEKDLSELENALNFALTNKYDYLILVGD